MTCPLSEKQDEPAALISRDPDLCRVLALMRVELRLLEDYCKSCQSLVWNRNGIHAVRYLIEQGAVAGHRGIVTENLDVVAAATPGAFGLILDPRWKLAGYRDDTI